MVDCTISSYSSQICAISYFFAAWLLNLLIIRMTSGGNKNLNTTNNVLLNKFPCTTRTYHRGRAILQNHIHLGIKFYFEYNREQRVKNIHENGVNINTWHGERVENKTGSSQVFTFTSVSVKFDCTATLNLRVFIRIVYLAQIIFCNFSLT